MKTLLNNEADWDTLKNKFIKPEYKGFSQLWKRQYPPSQYPCVAVEYYKEDDVAFRFVYRSDFEPTKLPAVS
jgi:hypothetical protein